MSRQRSGAFFRLGVITAALLLLAMGQAVQAKSVYLFANHHTGQFDAWDLWDDGTIHYKATYNLQCLSDPGGVDIWVETDALGFPQRSVIFITAEFSGSIEVVDPVSLTYIQCISTGASNLAGITMDDANRILYAIERSTNQLYALDWDPDAGTNGTLTTRPGFPIYLPNASAIMGLAYDPGTAILYVSDAGSGAVRGYDTATWAEVFTWVPAIAPIDLTCDTYRGKLYVSIPDGYCAAGIPPGTPMVCQYDLATGTEVDHALGTVGGIGIAVNEVTGYVYLTRGCAGDFVTVLDPTTSPWTEIQSTGPVGSPAGIAIDDAKVPGDPYVELAGTPGDCLMPGDATDANIRFGYTDALGAQLPATNVVAKVTLPADLLFVSATGAGLYDAINHMVLFDVGTLQPGDAFSETIVVQVASTADWEAVLPCFAVVESAEILPEDWDRDEHGFVVCAAPPFVPVYVDFHPRACPNPLLVFDQQGYAKAAILGTADFDVTLIDPATLQIHGVPAAMWKYQAIAAPVLDAQLEECECVEVPNDEYLDLVFQVPIQPLVATLGPVQHNDLAPATVGAVMFDGLSIQGSDCWRIIDHKPVANRTEVAIATLSKPDDPAQQIEFRVSQSGLVSLSVFDVSGRRVDELVAGIQTEGRHVVTWDASNHPSGVYFARLETDLEATTKKIVLVR